jgi:hypothetical protein
VNTKSRDLVNTILDSLAEDEKADCAGPDEFTIADFRLVMFGHGVDLSFTMAYDRLKKYEKEGRFTSRMGHNARGNVCRIYKPVEKPK